MRSLDSQSEFRIFLLKSIHESFPISFIGQLRQSDAGS